MAVGAVQKKSGQKYRTYRCAKQPGNHNCGHVTIGKVSTEQYVVEKTLAFLSEASLRPFESEQDLDELRRQVGDDEKAIHILNRKRYILRTLPESEYHPLHDELSARLEERRAMLEALESDLELREGALRLGNRDDLDQWWLSADTDARRLLLRQAFYEIRIHPAERAANRIDFSRVELRWNWSIYMRAAERFEGTATSEEMSAAEAEYNKLVEDSWLEQQEDNPVATRRVGNR